ncbi:hypothetical protein EAF00_009364 [Botryotinia globosa]|nr:hypothetical protein EAF00_009364 [Botryotinia globosa]
MANGVVKGKKLKRSLEDGNESRSVKRKTVHELQENGDKQIDIGSFLMNTADGKLLLDIFKLRKGNPMCLCTGCKIENRRERTKASDRGSGDEAGESMIMCPLQPQNITFTEPPANLNSEDVNEEEKNEVEAFKKAVARDEKL